MTEINTKEQRTRVINTLSDVGDHGNATAAAKRFTFKPRVQLLILRNSQYTGTKPSAYTLMLLSNA